MNANEAALERIQALPPAEIQAVRVALEELRTASNRVAARLEVAGASQYYPLWVLAQELYLAIARESIEHPVEDLDPADPEVVRVEAEHRSLVDIYRLQEQKR